MSWVALGTAAVGAVAGGGGGGGMGGGGSAVPGVLDSGHVTGGAFTFGQQNKGVNPWIIVAAVGVVVLGFVAWLVARGGNSKG